MTICKVSKIGDFSYALKHLVPNQSIQSEIRRSLSSIEGITEGLPAPEMLLTLTPADDAPTIAEYLDIFSGPINVDLDSESVWPIPPPLRI
jgi:hypothetical protein